MVIIKNLRKQLKSSIKMDGLKQAMSEELMKMVISKCSVEVKKCLRYPANLSHQEKWRLRYLIIQLETVQVVGVNDKITTEIGAAFIELKEGETLKRKDITDWCAERLAKFKIPRHVWFIESSDWPMTATGKVQKFRLQDLAEERIKR